MFRQLVSNLAFSPALIGQLGFYAKRLRKEEATRRIGLIFTALALIVQSFAVFQPPESANAAHPSNFINGGVSTKEQFVEAYDKNVNNIQDLMKAVGISRQNLVDMEKAPHYSKGKYSWGLTSRFSAAQGERSYPVRTDNGGLRNFHYRPLALWDNGSHETRYEGWVGHTSNGMWFAISKNCANLILKEHPPVPPCPPNMAGTYPYCTTPPKKKCEVPGKTHLDADDPACQPDPVASCESLTINRLLDSAYVFEGKTSTANGATVSAYVYTIKKNGKVIETKTVKSSERVNRYTYNQTGEGSYSVELTTKTSLGDKTGPNCVRTFNITPPPVCPLNPKLPASSPECQPCPGDTTLWIKDDKCSAQIVQTKKAENISQSTDATKVVAKPLDRIVYRLVVENTGNAPADFVIEEQLDDVMEYAQVIDSGNGTLDNTTMVWPAMTLAPKEVQTRMFTVQVNESVSAMPQGISDLASYDCEMVNTFGNAITIKVDCPVQKVAVENTVSQLPHTGAGANMIFAGGMFGIVSYFYARSRQTKKEVRLIRREFNSGTI